ncbi:unconventional myosin IC-like [Folsomia candida]|uniref:Myosin-IB n=1 Tax=Folsomia candida TaxID=158441 RepID=A0A226EGU0_FOLCA|nr:unconventional myosin IC-like [Folsomia candida]OXA56490.1 Myosin-IB [Folsomia candida]
MCKLLNKGFHSNQYHKMSSNKIRNKSCQTREKLELLRELDNVGVRDFLVLGNCDLIVTSQVLVGNLVKRFCSDICYTSIGRNLLLFVNPNKPLAIYSTVVKEIYAKLFHGNEELTTPPPHIYSTINCAIHDGLSSLCKSQTLLFSGESGSGKSTNYFHALDYLRFLGNHNEKIEQIFNHNLVLNYFGGAMETDSTRFVKLINLEFDFRGEVQGAGFECYHLEKWRLCGNYNTSNEAINCQNFHIFYILVGGCEGGVLKSLNLLRNPDNYKLLKLVNKNYGNLYPYSNGLLSNQEQAFQFLKKTLPLTPLEFTSLLQILSSILHLGNTTITMTTNLDGSEATTINYGPQNSSEIISNLLQVTQNIIPNITSLPNPSRILIALMQNIYTRLFSWLSRKLGIVSKGDKSFSLKLLDFTGFTDFHGNTNFENFIVNYVNEKVQMCLVDVRLRLHQEEWVRDGLEWIWIDTSGGGAVGEWLDWVEGPLIENSGGWGHKGDGDDGELSFIRLPPRHHGNNTPTTSPHKSQHPKKITNFYTHNPPDTLPPLSSRSSQPPRTPCSPPSTPPPTPPPPQPPPPNYSRTSPK